MPCSTNNKNPDIQKYGGLTGPVECVSSLSSCSRSSATVLILSPQFPIYVHWLPPTIYTFASWTGNVKNIHKPLVDNNTLAAEPAKMRGRWTTWTNLSPLLPTFLVFSHASLTLIYIYSLFLKEFWDKQERLCQKVLCIHSSTQENLSSFMEITTTNRHQLMLIFCNPRGLSSHQ